LSKVDDQNNKVIANSVKNRHEYMRLRILYLRVTSTMWLREWNWNWNWNYVVGTGKKMEMRT